MVIIKKSREIEQLRKAGRLVAQTFEVLKPHMVEGISTEELDEIAEDFIRSKGAIPIYKGYGGSAAMRGRAAIPPFPATLCVSVNDVICHGIPSEKQRLRNGDIVGVDIGVLYNGWVGDACVTFAIGTLDPETQRLMDVAKKCLDLGIEQARAGKHLGDIGAAIQTYAEAQGFSTVREYTGHGVGRSLHEEPYVMHYGEWGKGMKLRPGMVFTIEPMINAGKPNTKLMSDHWTVRTADGSKSAQFEHTLAITDGEPDILTVL